MGELTTQMMIGLTPVEALVQGQEVTWPTPFDALSWVPEAEPEFNQAEPRYPEAINDQLDRLGALAALELRRSLLGDIADYLGRRTSSVEEPEPRLEQTWRSGSGRSDRHFRKR